MSPKEKANKLFNKYSKGKDAHGWNLCEFDSCSKKCALIAVDEILDTLKSCLDEQGALNMYNYYNEVKQEIGKL